MATEDLKGIVDQRSSLQQKLTRMEELKDSVKPEIYEKIRFDYQNQLDGINNKLRTSQEFIQVELQEYQEQREKILKKKSALEDELEETTFRHTIGEFSQETFDVMKAKKQRELDESENKLQELETKIKSLQEMMGKEVPEKLPLEETPEKPPQEKIPENLPEEEDIGLELGALEELGEKIEALGEGEKEEPPKEEAKEKAADIGKISLDEILWDEGKLEQKSESAEGGPAPVPEEIPTLEEVEKPKDEVSLEESIKKEGEGLICPKCKTVNQSDNWYCEKCGTELLVEGAT